DTHRRLDCNGGKVRPPAKKSYTGGATKSILPVAPGRRGAVFPICRGVATSQRRLGLPVSDRGPRRRARGVTHIFLAWSAAIARIGSRRRQARPRGEAMQGARFGAKRFLKNKETWIMKMGKKIAICSG